MRVLMFPFGSGGDVHPFVGLGCALRERGHHVEVAASGYFGGMVRRAGLTFHELGTAQEYLDASSDPHLWNPRHGFAVLYRNGIQKIMERQYAMVMERAAQGPLLVLANGMGFGARVACEKSGAPLVTVHLQPAFLFSEERPPVLPGVWMAPWIPYSITRWQMAIGERWLVDRVACPTLNAFRRSVGLEPIARLSRWWNSPDGILCMFPSWFAPPARDWPQPHCVTEFPMWDESAITQLDPSLEDYLSRGDAPVVLTPGTGNQSARRFFAEGIEACVRSGKRALLLTQFPEQLPKSLPPGVKHFHYVPFSQVLPRTAAVLHHGGIGTLSQCLRAGVPQWIMPQSYDQPDNLDRVRKLGVGDGLKPARVSASAIAPMLQRLMTSETVRQRCREISERLKEVDPFAAAMDWLETKSR
jgi:rhamnosyltransferase subunit B